MTAKEYASQIRALMDSHGLNQRKVADLAGLTVTEVAHARSGDVSVETMKHIIDRIRWHKDGNKKAGINTWQ